MLRFFMLFFLLLNAYSSVIIRNSGDNVTLECFHSSRNSKVSWYKQVLGQTPQLICSIYGISKTFFNDFDHGERFSSYSSEGVEYLRISNLQPRDAAMYYCGGTSISITRFQSGNVLLVQASNSRPTSVLQHQSVSVSPGDSVHLNCTVTPGGRDGDLNFYWFWKNMHDSRPGVIFTNANTSHWCDRKSQSCVSNLWRGNVQDSDAGNYYCAVASCGEIVFGAGTKLLVKGSPDQRLWLVSLSAALLVSITINILTCALCGFSRTKHVRGHKQVERVCDVAEDEEEDVQYVAIDLSRRHSTRVSSREEKTLYSRVRIHSQPDRDATC
ncbi:uncharacterized protein ACB058_001143 [Synchiropus picturatus]